jgi:NADH-quinone oxidoreductase subunit C
MLRSGELRELLARDLAGALAPIPARYSAGNGGSVQEGAAASAKGVHREGTRPRLQDYDAVVNADSLPRVAAYLRDRHGYAFLSNITAVDYILDGLIEVV